jgi:hypothetical protein
MISAANYQLETSNGDSAVCVVQSILMQYFEVGSWIWTVIFSYDLSRELFFNLSKLQLNRQRRLFECRRHLIFYHLFVNCYSSISTILLIQLKLNARAGDWCWTNSKDWAIMTYSLLWLSFLVILANVIFVIWLTSRAERALMRAQSSSRLSRLSSRPTMSASDAGSVSHKAARRSRSMWRVTRRLLLIPIAYMLLHVPGTLRRIGTASSFQCAFCEGSTLAFVQGVCDPSQGTVNFVLFVCLDKQLQKEMRICWSRFRARWCCYEVESAARARTHTKARVSKTSSSPSSSSSLSTAPNFSCSSTMWCLHVCRRLCGAWWRQHDSSNLHEWENNPLSIVRTEIYRDEMANPAAKAIATSGEERPTRMRVAMGGGVEERPPANSMKKSNTVTFAISFEMSSAASEKGHVGKDFADIDGDNNSDDKADDDDDDDGDDDDERFTLTDENGESIIFRMSSSASKQ